MSVFVLDVDGTIHFGGARIFPGMLDMLSRISTSQQLVLASARHPTDVQALLPHALLAKLDIIGCNGAIAVRKGEICHCSLMDSETVVSVVSGLEAVRCPFLAYGIDFVIRGSAFHSLYGAVADSMQIVPIRSLRPKAGACVKILCLPAAGQKAVVEQVADMTGASIHSHEDGSFDITAQEVDKARAVEALGHALPVFAAFGNDTNDLEILLQSENAVCVGSHRQLARAAHYTVAGEEGVIRQLERLLASLS